MIDLSDSSWDEIKRLIANSTGLPQDLVFYTDLKYETKELRKVESMARARKVTDKLLDFWLANELNVLFEGRHGVGKTAMIKDCFERNGLKWKYFSAATMDPWCDFVGIPRVIEDENGKHLEYVLPQDLNDDSVQALFFDEFNRSHKKIQNAVMELIQFKSINGRKFKNLRVVWTAINPHDEDSDEYHVEKLDAALEDRFHIKVNVPFEPSITYFRNTFGEEGRRAVDWWKQLNSKVRAGVSPRRLDYALQVYKSDGDVSYVFGDGVNTKQFEETIRIGDIESVLAELMTKATPEDLEKWLASPNNLHSIESYITNAKGKRKTKMVGFWTPLLPLPSLTSLVTTDVVVRKFVVTNEEIHSDRFSSVLDSIISAHSQTSPGDKADKEMAKIIGEIVVTRRIKSGDPKVVAASIETELKTRFDKTEHLFNLRSVYASTTEKRFKAMDDLMDFLEQVEDAVASNDRYRFRFKDVVRRLTGRCNYQTFVSKKRKPTWERVVKFVNTNWPESERQTFVVSHYLDKFPETTIKRVKK